MASFAGAMALVICTRFIVSVQLRVTAGPFCCVLSSEETIVLTGAMVPFALGRTDGLFNPGNRS